jgi:type I restriction enzyme M protein
VGAGLLQINGFTYDHSERLGDAFEYLLSVLGSQGDAGQFRTPRHIIDFMVEVIDPKKNESVLDPACGTAGFLISAWKHILKQNTQARPGDQLTPEERASLAANMHGYDISPDMVRLSLVNMYLHGFTDPHIVEYDTLTSDERWNETADIILANPPFMSPKGGIKPHKRFSVQATRSEVLFVDYIAEHLSPQGRAAIVVPEGIIFQSGTAYKQLREMLVKTSLVAVVSLPAGVFNPYSGVKTSILIFDKRLAKTCDSVLFVKISNDGYNLGAQRRAVTGSDLPEAARLLREWMRGQFDEKSALATRVERARIGENGEWNLSGERYGEIQAHAGQYAAVTLGELCEYVRGVTYAKQDEVIDGGWPVLRANNIDASTSKLNLSDIKQVSADLNFSDAQRLRKNDILICAASGSADHVGKVAFIEEDTPYYFGGFMAVLRCNERVEPRFLFGCVRAETFRAHLAKSIAGANINNLKASIVHSYVIPLPPLAIQQEIVAEIESYQKIIDGARQVIENYRPSINLQRDWPIARLESLCEIVRGSSPRPQGDLRYFQGPVPRLMVADITRDGMRVTPQIDSLTEEGATKSRPMKAGSVVMAVSGNPGLPAILKIDACIHDGFVGFRSLDTTQVSPEFLYYVLLGKKDLHGLQSVGAVFKNLTTDQIREFSIPLPDLDTQRDIVAEIEAEQALVNANKQLIERFEAKIKTVINRVWGSTE